MSRQVPTFVAPRIVHVTTPTPGVVSATGVAHASTERPGTPRRPVVTSHPSVHHTRHAVSKPVLPSLAFLPRDLLRLVPGSFEVGTPGHDDGVLLLLASLAMGVLAVSSFVLLRRLKNLEERSS